MTMSQTESKTESNVGEITIPLNSFQKRLYYNLSDASRKVNQQHDPIVMVIEGNIDINFFWSVIGEIVERHDALRSSFKMVDNQPVQMIHDTVHFSIDYRKAGKEDMDDIVRGLSFDFNLSTPPLFRIYLVRIKAHRHVLVFDMHHLIADEISRKIIVKEIIKRYNGEVLPSHSISYRDYLQWHRKESFKKELKIQKQYWHERFSGKLPILDLPYDFNRPTQQDFKAEAISVVVETIALEKLKKITVASSCSLEHLFFALYNVLLMKYADQKDLIVGVPINIRKEDPMHAVVGFFINPVPIRTQPVPEKRFTAYLAEVKAVFAKAHENKNYLFSELVSELNLDQDESRHPLYDTFFTYHDMRDSGIQIKDMHISHELFIRKTTLYDLTFNVKKSIGRIEVIIEYHTSLFRRERVETLGKSYIYLIEQLLEDPQCEIGSFELEKKAPADWYIRTQIPSPRTVDRTNLYWLPIAKDFKTAVKTFTQKDAPPSEKLAKLRQLATHNLDFTGTAKIDNRLVTLSAELPEVPAGFATIKLAMLASSTNEHLPPGIRVGALRRGVLADIYVAPYGQYTQELINPESECRKYRPDAVLLAFNYHDLALNKLPLTADGAAVEDFVNEVISGWIQLWEIIINQLNAVVIQHTLVTPPEQCFGEYDLLLPASPGNVVNRINLALAEKATEHKALLLNMDAMAATVGKSIWCNDSIWDYGKQDVSPLQMPLYGDRVARILAAVRGKSKKCLVLDLDNTLWGGVIGDDGLAGIKLGQGNPAGEGHMAFQAYCKRLQERGVILAVCSKNDEKNALEPFEKHPDMVLKCNDISCFVANWENKASNLQRIAHELNIGVDALVFFDDNPAERDIVRRFLPTVAVPEVPTDPSWYVRCLSDAGYFDTVVFSNEDTAKTQQYIANAKRKRLQAESVSMDDFLKSLNMEMVAGEVDEFTLPRTTQLINKTNQFHLTTRRYTETQVKQMMEDPEILCLCFHLKDNFGDNGLISVIIAKPMEVDGRKIFHIDTWLMSCRVLGRRVEEASFDVLADRSFERGYNLLQGEYIQSAKNNMVKLHYQRLGFDCVYEGRTENGQLYTYWQFNFDEYKPLKTCIKTVWI
jgi:FkbH-like protein